MAAPAAAPAAGVGVSLSAVVGALVALGLLWTAQAWVGALFQVGTSLIGWVPWLGRRAANGLRAVEQRVNDRLNDAIDGTVEALSWSWQLFTRSLALTGDSLLWTARATWKTWWYVTSRYSVAALAVKAAKALGDSTLTRRLIDALQTSTVVIERVIERPWRGPIAAGARAATAPLRAELRWLARWTLPRVKALQHAIAVDLPADIAGLRSAGETLARAYERLRKLIARHERLLGAGALAAAVAYALARLGGTWIRCGNWRKAGRQVCRMDAGLLDTLLLDTLAIFGTLSIVALAEAMLSVEDEVVAGIKLGFRELHGV